MRRYVLILTSLVFITIISWTSVHVQGGRSPPGVLLELDDVEDETRQQEGHRHVRRAVEDSEEEDYEEAQIANRQKVRRTPPAVDQAKSVNLPDGYSIYEIPKDPSGSPMPLFVNVHIKKILDFDELNEMIKLDIEFIVMWTDFKILNFNADNATKEKVMKAHKFTVDEMDPDEVRAKRITLNNPFVLDKIWKPNLFIENLIAVRQPAIMARPLTIKFIPDVGWFEYITRISVKLDCDMDFHYYPADTQVCGFTIRGFSYVKKDLNLNWHGHGVFIDNLELPSFDVKVDETSHYDWQKNDDPNEVFEVLAFKIFLRRRLSYHLVQTYLASTFYIIITCLCFLVPPRLVEARIGISMTTLLTLTAMFASVRESTPIASYVKAIDIWMVCCIFFVFLTLAQFTTHIWLRSVKQDFDEKEDKRRQNRALVYSIAITGNDPPTPVTDGEPEPGLVSIKRRKQSVASTAFSEGTVRKYEKFADLIESYSFPLFLSIFAVYSIIYWSVLLSKADYFDWKVNSTLNKIVLED